MKVRRTSVVVVNSNAGLLLVECIRSIYVTAGHLSPEVVLVDNASLDGSVEAIKLAFPEVRILFLDKKLGFPSACNQGIQAASGDYILLLNPDAALVGGSLECMLDYLQEHPEVGIIGPRFLAGNHEPIISANRLPTTASLLGNLLPFSPALRLLPSRRPRNVDIPEGAGIREVGWVHGAAMAFKKTLIRDIGPLDPRLFWAGDLDICRRTWDAGLKVVYLPIAAVLHWEGVWGLRSYQVSIPTRLVAPVEYSKKYATWVETATVATAYAINAAVNWLSLSVAPSPGRSRAERARAFKEALIQIVESAPREAQGPAKKPHGAVPRGNPLQHEA